MIIEIVKTKNILFPIPKILAILFIKFGKTKKIGKISQKMNQKMKNLKDILSLFR
jgi:hypothetical protein